MIGAALSATLLAGGTAASASSSPASPSPEFTASGSSSSTPASPEPAAPASSSPSPAEPSAAVRRTPAARSLSVPRETEPAAGALPQTPAHAAGRRVSVDLGAVRVAHKERPPAAPAWVNPNPSGAVTSCFGPRWGRLHAGVDLAAPSGTPIVAAGAGVVVRAGPADGYGNAVLIDHGNGYLTHYGHLATITVTEGQGVAAGRQVGTEGSTGHSTGPHLHFEVHQGRYQNPVEPTEWMREHGVDITGCAG